MEGDKGEIVGLLNRVMAGMVALFRGAWIIGVGVV